MADSLNEKYVTRKEYQVDQRKNLERHHQHELKFERMEIRSQRMLEDLNGLPDTFKSLNKTMSTINSRIDDVEDVNEDLGERIGSMESSIQSRTEHNTKIIIALISLVGILATGAFSFAQVFFQ